MVADDVAEERLRGAVCAYVDALRAIELPPERAMLAVTDLLGRGGLERTGAADDAQTEALYDRALRWCAERYYGVEPGD